MKQFALSSVVATLLAISCSSSQAENWPQWRGLFGCGISMEQGIATQWSKTDHVLWRTPMPGQAGATPVVWGDHIFTTSADGNDLLLIALSVKDGKELWRRKVSGGNQDARAGEGNSASPPRRPMVNMSGSSLARECWPASITAARKSGASMSISATARSISSSE